MVRIELDPPITAAQLFAFYERNNICEVGFGPEVAARVLQHPHIGMKDFVIDERPYVKGS